MSCCKGQKKVHNSKLGKLGGWSFEPQLYEFLRENLEDGKTILELGSGYGTHVLSQHYKMISIEHNEKFIGIYQSRYILAPMNGYWYDRKSIEDNFPLEYDCILIDGPIGTQSKNRIGFFENIDMFDTNKLMIFDDTNRDGEKELFNRCLAWCNWDFGNETELPEDQHRKFEHFKTFSVIYPL